MPGVDHQACTAILGPAVDSIGEIRIQPALTGVWQFEGFPRAIRINGTRFTRSRVWTWPYAGVVAQYREAQPTCAAHLQVLEDGTWRIDHLDEANPDQGRVVEHFVEDTTPGKVLKPLLVGAGMLAAIYGLATVVATRRW